MLNKNKLKQKILEKLTLDIMQPEKLNKEIDNAITNVEFPNNPTDEEIDERVNDIWLGISTGICKHFMSNDKMWDKISEAIVEEIQENGEVLSPVDLVNNNVKNTRIAYKDVNGKIAYGYLAGFDDLGNQVSVVTVVPEEVSSGDNDILPSNINIDKSEISKSDIDLSKLKLT